MEWIAQFHEVAPPQSGKPWRLASASANGEDFPLWNTQHLENIREK
jgi:hypothetical protein